MKTTKNNPLRLKVLITAGFLLVGASVVMFLTLSSPFRNEFNGERAYQDVLAQVALGPRVPDSQAHEEVIVYIQNELKKAGWNSEVRQSDWNSFGIRNIVAHRSNSDAAIILGAHYDSRLLADQDPGPGGSKPVPGANDGASGVAILLELARTLPNNTVPIWLVFFDAEDNGGLDGRAWIMGSKAFVEGLDFTPRMAIIVDMVGDSDLNIYYERNSSSTLTNEIWTQAARLGYQDYFIPEPKYSMIDDHTPFLNAGIPAVDIIDFDYPYWHTSQDTPDKVSSNSLKVVGDTLKAWIETQH